MKILYFLPLIFAVCGSHCPSPAPNPPPPPPISQDATTVDGVTLGPCGFACTRYRQLGCPEGAPTPAGHSCEEVCENAAQNGIDLGGPSTCTAVAGTCQEVRACSK